MIIITHMGMTTSAASCHAVHSGLQPHSDLRDDDNSRDDRRKRSGLFRAGLASSFRERRLHREKKRQWPDAGIARVTRGGLVKKPIL